MSKYQLVAELNATYWGEIAKGASVKDAISETRRIHELTVVERDGKATLLSQAGTGRRAYEWRISNSNPTQNSYEVAK